VQPNGPLIHGIADEYKDHSGREITEDFPLWEPCHRHLLGNGIVGFENVGGQIDAVTGRRVTFAAFPWRWTQGDGCIVRLVAMVDPSGAFRIETGGA
jgi:kynurenine formamidase